MWASVMPHCPARQAADAAESFSRTRVRSPTFTLVTRSSITAPDDQPDVPISAMPHRRK